MRISTKLNYACVFAYGLIVAYVPFFKSNLMFYCIVGTLIISIPFIIWEIINPE